MFLYVFIDHTISYWSIYNTDTDGIEYFPAEFLGFDHHMPPFTTAKGDEILQGVNYASAGAGLRPETGKICV